MFTVNSIFNVSSTSYSNKFTHNSYINIYWRNLSILCLKLWDVCLSLIKCQFVCLFPYSSKRAESIESMGCKFFGRLKTMCSRKAFYCIKLYKNVLILLLLHLRHLCPIFSHLLLYKTSGLLRRGG